MNINVSSTAIDHANPHQGLTNLFTTKGANAIEFISYVVKQAPFRIKTNRTDSGRRFGPKFHPHVEDLGMEHHYIKVRTA